jgi:iron complex outermembrane receptor protein
VLPPGFIQKPPGKFQAYKGVQDDASLTDYGGSATAVYNAPGVDITSITAYRAQETHYFDDQTGIAPSALTADIKLRKHYFYQELRAISTSEGRFHFLGGASYLRTHTDGNSIIGYYPPLFTQTPTTSTGGVKNWSVYGQLGYDLTDHLNLTASGRYIHETNRVDFTSPVTASSEVSASKFLPSATLSYSLASGGNVYARYAKGFKAGGVNSVDPPTAYPTDFGKVFAPEQIDTYEIGYRAPLFDRTMQLTTAVFYNDYTGIQTFTNGNPSHPGIIFAIINSGSARTYGAESSLTWRVTSPFTLGVNASYLNARYKQFGNSDGAVLNTFDFSGRKMLFSPTWQLALTGDVDYPINDRCNFIANALVSYTDDIKFFNSAVQGIPDPIQPAYWLTNVRVGMRTSDDRYRVTLFANNLFNRGYVTLGQASAFGDLYRWGNPRIVGIEVRAKY